MANKGMSKVDLDKLKGSAISPSNPLPMRLSNGSAFDDAVGPLQFVAVTRLYDVDNNAVLLFDCDNANNANVVGIMITNCGTGTCYLGDSTVAVPGPSAKFLYALVEEEAKYFPVGYIVPTSQVNDIYGRRTAIVTNKKIAVTVFKRLVVS